MLYRLVDGLSGADSATSLSPASPFRPFVSKHSNCIAFDCAKQSTATPRLGHLQPLKGDNDSSSQPSFIEKLWLPDTFDGRRLVERTHCAVSMTKAIPSTRRIAALLKNAADDIYVADTAGLVLRLEREEAAADAHSQQRAASRPDAVEEPTTRGVWHELAGPSSTAPARGGFASFGADGGWVGLAQHPANLSALVCAREYFNDVRLVDVLTSNVLYSIATQHMPTAIASSEHSPHMHYVAEGPLVSLYDLRVGSPHVAQSTFTTLRGDRVSSLCRISNSTADRIAMCSTDRSVSTLDTRKWTKLFSVQNVLKYDVLNICAVQGGAALVCSGGDSEVRLVPLAAEPPAPSASKAEDTNCTESGGTFRTRLQDTVQCATVWHGAGWVSDGNAAVGLSQGNELFAAF